MGEIHVLFYRRRSELSEIQTKLYIYMDRCHHSAERVFHEVSYIVMGKWITLRTLTYMRGSEIFHRTKGSAEVTDRINFLLSQC